MFGVIGMKIREAFLFIRDYSFYIVAVFNIILALIAKTKGIINSWSFFFMLATLPMWGTFLVILITFMILWCMGCFDKKE